MRSIIDQLMPSLTGYAPKLLAALVILVLGWTAAAIVAAVVRGAMRRTRLDNRLAERLVGEEAAKSVDTARWMGRIAFYVVVFVTLVAFMQTLGLELATQPLNGLLTRVFEYAPRLIAAGLLLLLAWIIAGALRLIISKTLTAARLDERVSEQVELGAERAMPLTTALSDAAYWLTFLLFLPAVLTALDLSGLLGPVQGMVNEVLGFLPNITAAAVILVVGWFVARIVQRAVTNVLVSVGADRLGERTGVQSVLGSHSLSSAVGLVVYVLVLMPTLVAALGALELTSITTPATGVLDQILGATPAMFGAALVLVVSFVVGKIVGGLVNSVLENVGFDSVLIRLGLTNAPVEGATTPSKIMGHVVHVSVMLFAVLEASHMLGFVVLSGLMAQFVLLAGRVLLGLAIFGVGLYLSQIAARVVRGSHTDFAGPLSLATRAALIILTSAMALRHMGLANEIINIAFGVTLGAIAVAAAIAFGVGGRDIAKRLLEEWVASLSEAGSSEEQ